VESRREKAEGTRQMAACREVWGLNGPYGYWVLRYGVGDEPPVSIFKFLVSNF
jgi:hypothetical protein